MPWCVTQPVKQLPPAFSEQLVSGDTKKLTRSAKLPKGRGQLIEQTVELYNPRKPFSFRYRFRTAIQIARFHSLIKSRWTIYHLHLSIQFLLFSYSVSDAPPPHVVTANCNADNILDQRLGKPGVVDLYKKLLTAILKFCQERWGKKRSVHIGWGLLVWIRIKFTWTKRQRPSESLLFARSRGGYWVDGSVKRRNWITIKIKEESSET